LFLPKLRDPEMEAMNWTPDLGPLVKV
jgi:hypothetical protein